MKREVIHTRMIAVNCFETDEEMPIIERSLSYERLFPHGIRALKEKSPDEGLIHLVNVMMEQCSQQWLYVA